MKDDKYKDIASWIDQVKIALVNQDGDKAFELTQTLPNFNHIENEYDKIELLSVVKELIFQTIQLLQQDQNNIREKIKKIKQAKKFFT